MRKLNFLPLLLILTLAITSCKKKDDVTGSLTMNFQLQNDGTDLDLGTFFSNDAGTDLRISLMQFYICDLTLVTSKDESCIVNEIEHIQLGTSGDGSMTVDVPKAKYKSISFHLGVRSDLNEADPTTYNDPDHPLNVTEGTYWGWASLYRFASLEGNYDIEPDGTIDGTFAYHTGFNESYKEVVFDIDMKMEEDGSQVMNFKIDAGMLFDNGASSIDPLTESTYHGNYAEVDLSSRLMTNFAAGMSME